MMLNATPILGLYAWGRLARLAAQDPLATQQAQLARLLRHAADTRFGHAHDFAGLRDVASYQARVPLRRYEQFWTEYWSAAFPNFADVTWPGRIPYLAASSGTTSGDTKFIPVSRQMVASNRRAALTLLSFHYQACPQTRIMGGKNFLLGGNAELMRRAAGIHSGDLSGIAANELPWWTKGRYFPPEDLSRIGDWEQKVECLASLSLGEDIRMLGGTVSWLLAFIERALACKPGAVRLHDIYPNLNLLIHGGVNYAPYKRRFDELLAGSHAETREVYPASEGFVALADRNPGEGLRLLLDNGLFFEFVPVEELDADRPTRHWVRTIETGQNYAVVLTTNAGLWSYILGDTVRFVDRNTPRLLITGRTSYFLSAFGEHLIGEEIESSVELAAAATDVNVRDYAVGAIYPDRQGEKGRHLFVVEFAGEVGPQTVERFTEVLDKSLAEANLDYREHRLNDVQMLAPVVQVAKAGTFAEWMKARGKLGAQNKVPRVINDAELFQSLRDVVR